MLIINREEWGGFFDHPAPPRIIAHNNVDTDLVDGKALPGCRQLLPEPILLHPDEPPAFTAERRQGKPNFVIVVDHASARIRIARPLIPTRSYCGKPGPPTTSRPLRTDNNQRDPMSRYAVGKGPGATAEVLFLPGIA